MVTHNSQSGECKAMKQHSELMQATPLRLLHIQRALHVTKEVIRLQISRISVQKHTRQQYARYGAHGGGDLWDDGISTTHI